MKTETTPNLTNAQAEILVREIYDNFPEASMCLTCVDWKYKELAALSGGEKI